MDKDEGGYDQIRKWIVKDLFGSTNLTENYACGETYKYRGTRFDKYEGEDTRWICLCVYQKRLCIIPWTCRPWRRFEINWRVSICLRVCSWHNDYRVEEARRIRFARTCQYLQQNIHWLGEAWGGVRWGQDNYFVVLITSLWSLGDTIATTLLSFSQMRHYSKEGSQGGEV